MVSRNRLVDGTYMRFAARVVQIIILCCSKEANRLLIQVHLEFCTEQHTSCEGDVM